ncbi:hypothetical protein QBC37DRAFT_376112 [Rhypophila decipiens]|uniref:Uncharacterized protein n=1 Tax=Rhypophila decipiens TaxID=261697 RepID=A0AAN6Y3W6_9PEZI|nr:hypothetical protein QBC37DRAFT_376112 [Rhypophila decipiens]
MPFWDNQAEQNVFGQDPETSAIHLQDGKEATLWPFSGSAVPSEQQVQQQHKMASTAALGYGSLADYYDLTKAIDSFIADIPDSPPSSSDDESSSDRGSSPSLSDLSPDRSFALLTLDSPDTAATTPTPPGSPNFKPWEQFLPKTTPPHLRAFRLSSRRPKSTRPGRLQLSVQPPKLLTKHEPQLLEPIETSSTASGLNIFDSLEDTSFLLPSPLSPCMPANFPRAPQNSPDEAYFPSSATSAPIPIPGASSDKTLNNEPEMLEMKAPTEYDSIIETKTCRRTPYYPPNASQTEDRSRVYMNRGPHYIANWTPLSSLPIEAQRRIQRSMVKFTAPEGPEEE